MSTTDDLRAMREAKYARARAARGGTPPPPVVRRPAPVAPGDPVVAEERPEAEAAVCGHRNMGGRTCTREPGHAAKSHRYS